MTTPEGGQSTKREAWERAKNAFLPFSKSSFVWAAVIAALLLLFVNFQPTRFIGWVLGPTGKVYVSSPGVYTRERLVNDRNDEDFWLRAQLRLLDDSEVGFSTVTRSELRLTADVSGVSAGDDGSAGPATGQAPGKAGGASSSTSDSSVQPTLPFLDSFAIRTAARDSIRQSILENLLDDRHDLTGNSVYGLKFDTTVIPGRFTTGRAFVRLSIMPGQAELVPEEGKPDANFPDLPLHLRTYFQSTFSQISNDPRNPNYNSFKLYSQWRSNVLWRLNSHFMQIVETKCQCKGALCSPPSAEWRAEVLSTVNTILAIDGAEMKSGQTSEGSVAFNKIILPAPWNNFLLINVSMPKISDCSKVPAFVVNSVDDTIHVRAKGETIPEYQLVDAVDDQVSAYVYVPKSEEADQSFWPHYRNIPSIVRYVQSIGKLLNYCFDKTKKETCVEYVTIPSGYFNFIEKVIQPDMYAYSLFPRLEATSALSAQSNSRAARYSGNGGPAVGVDSTESSNEASLMPTAIGFTDAQSSEAVDLGWIVDVGRNGAPFQKSQFALISVPAWTSRLTIAVRTGWLDSSSTENATEFYSYAVPIPPDYEAFDSFIGGQESVRRPQINEELMDNNIKLVACRKASILIPGLRLWRSAMVTVGSERADRITVLPNMRGIIAEFTKLSRSSATGDATLRVWTSEGVDSLPDKVNIAPPEDPADCEDRLSQSAMPPPPPKVSVPVAGAKPN